MLVVSVTNTPGRAQVCVVSIVLSGFLYQLLDILGDSSWIVVTPRLKNTDLKDSVDAYVTILGQPFCDWSDLLQTVNPHTPERKCVLSTRHGSPILDVELIRGGSNLSHQLLWCVWLSSRVFSAAPPSLISLSLFSWTVSVNLYIKYLIVYWFFYYQLPIVKSKIKFC